MPLIDQPDTPQIKEFLLSPSAGEVQNIEPHLLRREQCARIVNADISVQGARQRLSGHSPMGVPNSIDVTGTPVTHPCTGLAVLFNPASTNVPTLLVCKYGSRLYGQFESTSVGGGWWFTGYSSVSLPETDVYHGAAINGTLFLVNALPATEGFYSNTIRITASDCTSLRGDWFGYKQVVNYLNRIWALTSDALFWSDIGSITLPNILGGTHCIRWKDVENNVAVIPLRGSTPRILVCRESSFWILDIYWSTDGYWATTANSLDYTKSLIRPVVQEVGLAAPRCIAWVPGVGGPFGTGDYLFLSRDGIRSLSRSISDEQGGAGLPISYPIQPIIDRINWVCASRSVAVYHAGYAYFGIPVDGATEPNMTLIYDINRSAWIESDLSIRAVAKLSWRGQELRTYFALGTTVSEDYGTGRGVRFGYHMYELGTGTNWPGSGPIPYLEETRSLVFDLENVPGSGLGYKKRWDWTSLKFEAGASNATISLYYRLDGNTPWTKIRDLSVPASATDLIEHKISLWDLRPGENLQFKLYDPNSFSKWRLIDWIATAYPQNVTFSG